jgi:hypothetical protein
MRAQPIGGVGQTILMQRAREQDRAASQPGPRPRMMANTRPAASPTPAPTNGSTGSTSASCQRGAPTSSLRPVKNVACSLKACSHSSKEEGRAIGGSLGLVMIGQI